MTFSQTKNHTFWIFLEGSEVSMWAALCGPALGTTNHCLRKWPMRSESTSNWTLQYPFSSIKQGMYPMVCGKPMHRRIGLRLSCKYNCCQDAYFSWRPHAVFMAMTACVLTDHFLDDMLTTILQSRFFQAAEASGSHF